MNRFLTLICLLCGTAALAQTTTDRAIRISASVTGNPASITLNWETTSSGTGSYSIYTKTKGSTMWSSVPISLPASANSYKDNNVTVGTGVEYYIYKADGTSPRGYIYAGIEEPPIHNRGAILLLVDSTFTDSCKTEIAALMTDLRGDGWQVLRGDFSRNTKVADIKSYIVSTSQQTSGLNALYILGHIAVPHSGNINPDAHTNHVGGWSADTYYGELDGSWSDNAINNTTSANSKNHNVPGDGNFDQSLIPSDIDLQVGRVDFYDMPQFGKTEVQLMKSYLNKAHTYKSGTMTIVKKGLIDDNFKSYAEGFAVNGWSNFSALVGKDNVSEKNFITTLNTDFHQWAYGCGGGTYISAGGIGNTSDFESNNVKAIFTPLFGSYFGDWDYKNSFLRAPLCADDPSLACFWAGRPNYFLHHMALGENLGYSIRLSQNNSGLYSPAGAGARWVHTGLMGDPTLRTDYVRSASSVTVTSNPNAGAILNWAASPEPNVKGYYIYRSDKEFGQYKLRSDLVTSTSFTDSFGKDGMYYYMVRASVLEQTASGSYYNLSLGDIASGNITYPYDEVGITGLTTNLSKIELYPNPTGNVTTLKIGSLSNIDATISITDLQGRILHTQNASLDIGDNYYKLNMANYASGMYFVHIHTDGDIQTIKLMKNE
ncbi:MAG: T9SS type A sorting domain-containing protein [Chitinophagales bacterium]|nr:T9SS type A sorting domain-containing protein [Chitinophagaceae bacterium]MCB9066089.1 T9SS type A sorting domain-containing protein [Chitinophagales bacterium]